MLKYSSVVAGIFLVGSAAFGNPTLSPADKAAIERDVATEVTVLDQTFDASHHGRGKGRAFKACKKVNLTAEQKTAIRNAFYEFRKTQILARANLRVSELELARALSSAEGQQESAVSAAQTVAQNKAAVAKNRADLKVNIFFNILQPEQKHNAYICMKALERHHSYRAKHHRGKWGKHHRRGHHGRGHGHGHDNGYDGYSY